MDSRPLKKQLKLKQKRSLKNKDRFSKDKERYSIRESIPMKTCFILGLTISIELEVMTMANVTTSKVDTKCGFGSTATTITVFQNDMPQSEDTH